MIIIKIIVFAIALLSTTFFLTQFCVNIAHKKDVYKINFLVAVSIVNWVVFYSLHLIK